MTDTTQAGVLQTAPAAPPTETNWADAFTAAEPQKSEQAAAETKEAPAEQPATEPETKPEAKPEAKTDESEQPITSLKDLAAYLKANEDDLYDLNVPVKVDGREDTKSLRDIIKNYQLDAHVTQKSQEVSALRQQAEQLLQQHQQAAQAELQRLQSLAQLGQQMINQDFQGVDWAKLQAEDPVQYNTLRLAYSDRSNQINGYLQAVAQQSQQQQAQAVARQQAQIEATVKAVQAERPEWQNPEIFNKDCVAIRAEFLAHGFKQEDLPALLSSPAYLKAADAAAKYWALQKAKPEIEKKVVAAPKFVKASGSAAQPKTKAQAALSAFRSNPKNRDAQDAAFEALIS